MNRRCLYSNLLSSFFRSLIAFFSVQLKWSYYLFSPKTYAKRTTKVALVNGFWNISRKQYLCIDCFSWKNFITCNNKIGSRYYACWLTRIFLQGNSVASCATLNKWVFINGEGSSLSEPVACCHNFFQPVGLVWPAVPDLPVHALFWCIEYYVLIYCYSCFLYFLLLLFSCFHKLSLCLKLIVWILGSRWE